MYLTLPHLRYYVSMYRNMKGITQSQITQSDAILPDITMICSKEDCVIELVVQLISKGRHKASLYQFHIMNM